MTILLGSSLENSDKTLEDRGPSMALSMEQPMPPPPSQIPSLSLSPKLQGPFLCWNLFPEPISCTAHIFYPCDFLNKRSRMV